MNTAGKQTPRNGKKGEMSQAETSERKERWHALRLLGTSSLKVGAMCHIYSLLGNDSVYTFQRTHKSRSCVLGRPCYNTLLGNTTITDKRRRFLFHGVGPDAISSLFVAKGIRELKLKNLVEFWRVGSPRWLKKKWQEDFIIIWSDSSCVEIRCQETNSYD
jgi:hypothetical protein